MLKRILKITAITLCIILSVTGIYFAYNWLTGNFHTITEGTAYRSRQLDKKKFEHYIKKYNIKSILNLRGDEPGVKWYEDEISISKAYNIIRLDLELPAMKEPEDKDIETIIRFLKTAPRPVLIHCLGGSDRSGLIAAVWEIAIEKQPKEKAEKQLSFLYGHMPFGKARAMDRWLASRKIDADTGVISKLQQ
ncbi:MAG: tyrosine-protein phosphatase [Endomicrobiaceae bacterium]